MFFAGPSSKVKAINFRWGCTYEISTIEVSHISLFDEDSISMGRGGSALKCEEDGGRYALKLLSGAPLPQADIVVRHKNAIVRACNLCIYKVFVFSMVIMRFYQKLKNGLTAQGNICYNNILPKCVSKTHKTAYE